MSEYGAWMIGFQRARLCFLSFPARRACRANWEIGPLVVRSAGRAKDAESLRAMGLTPEQCARLQAALLALHDDEPKWSRRARHEIVSDATHYIQFDQPDVVIRAVREVLAASVAKRRARTAVSPMVLFPSSISLTDTNGWTGGAV